LILLITCCAQIPLSWAKNCIDWPRVMAQYELSLQPQAKTILVSPFSNYTKQPEDDWLSTGIRDFIADLLLSSKNVKVFAGPTALHSAEAGAADFTVSGKFQRAADGMQVFISFTDKKSGRLIKQLEASFPYPDNSEFFSKIADAVQIILGEMQAKGDQSQFMSVLNATTFTKAYESYSKGRQLLETYMVGNMKQASDLFTQAKSIDYRSPLGYEGIISVNTFLGFYNKQMRKPFSTYYQQAESELVNMQKITRTRSLVFAFTPKKAIKKQGADGELKNRFLLSNAAFVEALHSSQVDNFEGAREAMLRCVDLVPEDAIAWYELANIESRLGNAEASGTARQKAYSINACIEK
jgi:tetratricopeptide (TPR) repeat protein